MNEYTPEEEERFLERYESKKDSNELISGFLFLLFVVCIGVCAKLYSWLTS